MKSIFEKIENRMLLNINVKVMALIGIRNWEEVIKQPLLVGVQTKPGVDYSLIVGEIKGFLSSQRFGLLESLGEALFTHLKEKFEVSSLKVQKTVGGSTGFTVEVEIS